MRCSGALRDRTHGRGFVSCGRDHSGRGVEQLGDPPLPSLLPGDAPRFHSLSAPPPNASYRSLLEHEAFLIFAFLRFGLERFRHSGEIH